MGESEWCICFSVLCFLTLFSCSLLCTGTNCNKFHLIITIQLIHRHLRISLRARKMTSERFKPIPFCSTFILFLLLLFFYYNIYHIFCLYIKFLSPLYFLTPFHHNLRWSGEISILYSRRACDALRTCNYCSQKSRLYQCKSCLVWAITTLCNGWIMVSLRPIPLSRLERSEDN